MSSDKWPAGLVHTIINTATVYKSLSPNEWNQGACALCSHIIKWLTSSEINDNQLENVNSPNYSLHSNELPDDSKNFV